MAWSVYDLDNGLALSDVIRAGQRMTFGPIKTEWFRDAPVKANSRMIQHLRRSKGQGDRIAIITSRLSTPESKALTLKWLRGFSIPFDKVIFRNPNDRNPDKVYKPWALIREGLIGQQVTKIVTSTKDLASYYARLGIKQEVV